MFVGADGCRAGWFSVLIKKDNNWKVDIFPDVASLWNKYKNVSVIFIDIPIGLKEKGFKERFCDLEARKLLGPKRRSSVFPAPCRKAIYAETHKEASNINKKLTGRRLSFQTWNIIPKIRQVDILLSKDESARSYIREIHPEVCFLVLAGHPLKYSKKMHKGFLERMKILQSVYPRTGEIIKYTLSNYKQKDVAKDDILDALVAAITAKMGFKRFISIPKSPEFDSKGLRMEIVYCPCNTRGKEGE